MESATSGYNPDTGDILIRVLPAADLSPPERRRLPQALIAGLGNSVRVTVEVTADLEAGEDANLYGGGRLELQGSGTLGCTGGFNVSQGVGVHGVLTAGHCNDALTHENYPGSAETTLYGQAAHLGYWGDFQWHTSNGFELDDFYYNAGVVRDVAAVGTPVKGQTLCAFGHMTYGAWCDVVYQLDHCNGSACRLVAMENDIAQSGDSGGPWYYGSTAYGVHQGYKWWFGSRDVFSRADYVEMR